LRGTFQNKPPGSALHSERLDTVRPNAPASTSCWFSGKTQEHACSGRASVRSLASWVLPGDCPRPAL